jgi:hypothetical protein
MDHARWPRHDFALPSRLRCEASASLHERDLRVAAVRQSASPCSGVWPRNRLILPPRARLQSFYATGDEPFFARSVTAALSIKARRTCALSNQARPPADLFQVSGLDEKDPFVRRAPIPPGVSNAKNRSTSQIASNDKPTKAQAREQRFLSSRVCVPRHRMLGWRWHERRRRIDARRWLGRSWSVWWFRGC